MSDGMGKTHSLDHITNHFVYGQGNRRTKEAASLSWARIYSGGRCWSEGCSPTFASSTRNLSLREVSLVPFLLFFSGHGGSGNVCI